MHLPPGQASEPEKRPHALTVVGGEYAAMAREATADLPAWFRPVAMAFVYAYGLFMSVLVAPFALLQIPRIRRYLRLCQAVSSHVQRVWREESPEAAMAVARRVFDELAQAYPRRVRIPPYGAATSRWALGYVGKLAYSGYAELDDWHSALEVAERVLEVSGDDGNWQWEISKAKALWNTGRSSEARAMLLPLLSREHAGTEARRLLESWKGIPHAP